MITIKIEKTGDILNLDADYNKSNVEECEMVFLMCQALHIRKMMEKPAKEAALNMNSIYSNRIN